MLEKFCTVVSSGCSVFDVEHFQHLTYKDFTVVKASDDDHKPLYSNSYCGAGRDAAVIWNQGSMLSVVVIVSSMAGWPLHCLSPMSLLLK